MQRKIIHVDMDCFYAAVEVRDNPYLKGKPVAVGGSSDRRGVISTANYEARKYGVRSALPTATALRLCPDLMLVRHNFDKYKEASQEIRSVFKEYTAVIQPLSLDEAFLDVTGAEHCEGSATLIAREIRQKIKQRTGLDASAGIAPNKFLAKIASDWRKPNGQFTIRPQDIEKFMLKLPVKKIFGVGKVTAKKLHEAGVQTCADLQKFNKTELIRKFGNWAESLYDLSRGIDERPVKERSQSKSLSVENTYSKDLPSKEKCLEALKDLKASWEVRFEKSKYTEGDIKSVSLKVKFHDFKQLTREMQIDHEPTMKEVEQLLDKVWSLRPEPVRLLGVGVKLKSSQKVSSKQISLFEESEL